MFINTPTVIFVTVFVWGNIFDQHLEINILPRNLFGGIVRFIFGLLLCGIILTANARVLHVGENVIKLSQTKTTSPALHIKVDDELWYGNMYNIFALDTLHVRYNNVNYSVLNCEPFTDTTNYTYDENGRLIGANENIYLKGTGTQYIDTLYLPTLITRSEMEIKFSENEYKTSGGECFFGSNDKKNKSNYSMNFGTGSAQVYQIYVWPCIYRDPSWCTIRNLNINKKLKTTKQLVVFDTKNNIAKYGTISTELQGRNAVGSAALLLFGIRSIKENGTESISVYSRDNAMYIYSTKIYEDDTLVRHFVPVPCGLQIGDFVVPSNGMWDIVEQKFYGNMGTGDFIYGIDE